MHYEKGKSYHIRYRGHYTEYLVKGDPAITADAARIWLGLELKVKHRPEVAEWHELRIKEFDAAPGQPGVWKATVEDPYKD